MQLLLTSAIRKSIENDAIQNLSKLSDSDHKQRVSPSKNFSVCPWLQSDQPLNQVYAKKIVSPRQNQFKLRPQSMRVRHPVYNVSHRLYKPWKLNRMNDKENQNANVSKNEPDIKVKLMECYGHTGSFDNVAQPLMPILPLIKESKQRESRNKHLNCLSHLVLLKTAKGVPTNEVCNNKTTWMKPYATCMNAGSCRRVQNMTRDDRRKDSVNADDKLQNRSNFIKDNLRKRNKKVSEFSRYYSKLMKENILHTHKPMHIV